MEYNHFDIGEKMDIKEIQNKLKQKIEDADLILIGIGNELKTEKEEKEIYQQKGKKQIFKENLENRAVNNQKFYKRCFSVYEKIQGRKSNQALLNLANILQNKNYFVISTNVDECLYLSGFRYIVSPCGRERLFQCSENCSNLTWENDTYLKQLFSESEGQQILSEIMKAEKTDFSKEKWNLLLPKCTKCGKFADFNKINFNKKELYCEHYLPEWEKYMKWLSGTLNKKLLLLELGVDFIYPQLIRWPFEKTALLNQKAFLVRVHKSLSNIPEELKERAEAITIDSKELLETIC